jgi:endo-1,4-beta-xylanase
MRLFRAAGAILATSSLILVVSSGAKWQVPTANSPPILNLPSAAVNLIAGQHWQLNGVSLGQDARTGQPALNVVNTDRAIVRQDGSPGQLDPAVNLYGTRLQTIGDFSVAATLTGVTGNAAISLYGTPPLIEDEFRAELGTLDMVIKGSTFVVGLSNQRSGNLVEKASSAIGSAADHTVKVSDIGGKLKFTVDGQAVATLPDRGIFSSRQVWLGLDARTTGSAFEVSALTAQGEAGGSVAAVDTRSQTIAPLPGGLDALATARRPSFLIGTAVALGPLVADPGYASLLGNYNLLATENVAKFQTIHPRVGNDPAAYNFADMDAVVAIAHRAGAQVHGHALVFAEANPAWVQDIAKNHPEQLQKVMTDHITTVVGHYKGQVKSWDVINEPLADYDTAAGVNGLRQHIWYQAIGPSYIATALRAAHAADPAAELWINDFGLESDDDRMGQMVALAQGLVQQGVPLTGIGFQAHIDNGDTIANDTHINTKQLPAHFAALQALGLKARVSELDVSNAREQPVFADVYGACLSAPNCTGVTTWGFTDKYSSAGSLGRRGIFSPGTGLPWDKNLKPLGAVSAIKNVL